jgi:hypothetical protein
MSTKKLRDDSYSQNIDYLHPHGKPMEEVQADEEQTIEKQVESRKQTRRAIEEADGHHICATDCQRHHRIEARSVRGIRWLKPLRRR